MHYVSLDLFFPCLLVFFPQNSTSQLNRLTSYQLHSPAVVCRGVKQSKHSAKCVCMCVCVDVCVCRQEFCSEACPDLTKEVYLQDIHCVGSLCKLYFRELPNPLLTYELYSKFTVSTFKSHLWSDLGGWGGLCGVVWLQIRLDSIYTHHSWEIL